MCATVDNGGKGETIMRRLIYRLSRGGTNGAQCKRERECEKRRKKGKSGEMGKGNARRHPKSNVGSAHRCISSS